MKKIAIIYQSISGNTKKIAERIAEGFAHYDDVIIDTLPLKELTISSLHAYDGFIIGTYTWGNGELPNDMIECYLAIDREAGLNKKITGVFGSGDTNFPHFCKAVDILADLLAVKTKLVLKMKIELDPVGDDLERCKRFAARYYDALCSSPAFA